MLKWLESTVSWLVRTFKPLLRYVGQTRTNTRNIGNQRIYIYMLKARRYYNSTMSCIKPDGLMVQHA